MGGRNLFDAFPAAPDLVKILRDSLRRALASGRTDALSQVRYPGAAKDGEVPVDRLWSCSHVPLKRRDGAVAYILQHVQDITDLHRAGGKEDAAAPRTETLGSAVLDRAERIQALNLSLIAESAQLRDLFMNAPSFMCLLRGPDYRIELANLAFRELVGQREMTGRSFRDAIPEVDGQLYLDLLDTV